ncbi:putative minor capsid [Achromobacter phage kwar_LB4]|nr:putative minor capsid [Achromobacter phage kwar_LB4]
MRLPARNWVRPSTTPWASASLPNCRHWQANSTTNPQPPS